MISDDDEDEDEDEGSGNELGENSQDDGTDNERSEDHNAATLLSDEACNVHLSLHNFELTFYIHSQAAQVVPRGGQQKKGQILIFHNASFTQFDTCQTPMQQNQNRSHTLLLHALVLVVINLIMLVQILKHLPLLILMEKQRAPKTICHHHHQR